MNWEKIDNLFEKYKAGYFAILTAIVGAATIIIATIVYHLGPKGPLTFTSHWISHLGAGPTAGIIFTIGLFLTGILALPFLIFLYRLMEPVSEKHRIMRLAALIASLISIAGLFINAAWNMDYQGGTLHVTGSTTFFFAGLFMIIFYSLLMFLHPDIPWQQAIFGLLVASIFAGFLISFLPVIATGADLMELLTSTDPVAGTTRFLEWIVFFAIISWFLEMGLYTLKKA
ncbi:MAG: DUF998 domain-containing protein [Promethearchaeota archaeon]